LVDQQLAAWADAFAHTLEESCRSRD